MFQGQRERIYFSCLPHITIYKFLALELSLLPCPQHWIFPLRLIQTSSPYAESCIPFTDNTVGPMLNTGDRLCSGLAEGPQIVPISLQKSQLCPRKPESKKWQFPDSKPSREKAIKKPVRKAGMVPLSPLPYMMRNTLKKTSLRPKRYIYHVLQYSL